MRFRLAQFFSWITLKLKVEMKVAHVLMGCNFKTHKRSNIHLLLNMDMKSGIMFHLPPFTIELYAQRKVKSVIYGLYLKPV